MGMPLIIAIVAVLAVCGGVILWNNKRAQRTLEQHTMTPEALHAARASNPALLIFDVRQPLDLLAYPEIIPGAKRIAPAEILARPALIPKEEDSVVYCTFPATRPAAKSCSMRWKGSCIGSSSSKEDWRVGKPWAIPSKDTKKFSTFTFHQPLRQPSSL